VWQALTREAFWLSRVDRSALTMFCERVALRRTLGAALAKTTDPHRRRILGWRIDQTASDMRASATALSLTAMPIWRDCGPAEHGIEVFIDWAMREAT
jgi:hypothetical protein